MSKPVIGMVIGGLLGLLDGVSTIFAGPDVRSMLAMIIVITTFKGLVAGAAAGFFARRFRSLPLGIAFGLLIGLLLAFVVAAMPSRSGEHYYFEIMLPGGIVGAIVGFATQRYGATAPTAHRSAGL